MWRCPHCATPQPEAARCWVCKRSSTSCGTCRNFRRSVAVQMGYCGLDRRRLPLLGDEIRPCWEAPAPAALEEPAADPRQELTRTSVRSLDFVAVGDGLPAMAVADAVPAVAVASGPESASLWGEPTDS